MSGRVAARLKELNLTLPDAPAPVANYVPAVRAGSILHVSGQIPLEGGKPQFVGKLGRDLQVADGQKAARLCAEGLVSVGGATVSKPNHAVRVGDVVRLPQGRQWRTVRVLALGARRGPAAEAQGLYEEAAPPQPLRERLADWEPLLVDAADADLR